MSSHREAIVNDKPYVDPNPLPSSVPHVEELGVTSAPLKSASFFIGEYCKEVNGECPSWCLSSDNVHGSLCAMRRTSARTFRLQTEGVRTLDLARRLELESWRTRLVQSGLEG